MTAKGVVFVNLEDETGLVNVICPLPVWERYGPVARSSPGLLVRGKLEKADGAINVLASPSKPSRCWPGLRTCVPGTSAEAPGGRAAGPAI